MLDSTLCSDADTVLGSAANAEKTTSPDETFKKLIVAMLEQLSPKLI